MIRYFTLLSAFIMFAYCEDCNLRDFPDGTVCVCDATYCDTVPGLEATFGIYQLYSTSKSQLGFNSQTGSFVDSTAVSINTIRVDQSTKYQTITGFGGAFTDSAGINIKSLPEEAQQKLLESYFGESGIEYSLCRVPIGGTDFSTRAYSYDDVSLDTTLESFDLQPEDINYKIPLIQKAKSLRNNNLNLFASPWTAPPWMKTRDDWHSGALQTEYYQLWADYIIKFFDEYAKHNISFWGLTPQNEPIDGFIPYPLEKLNAMAWTPEQMNTWIGDNLGPTIKNSTHKDVKIIIHDDSRLTIPLLRLLLNDEKTMSYVDGVGVHWYMDPIIPASVLGTIRSDFKDVFILSTEACSGYVAWTGQQPVRKGFWDRGASYVVDIFENLEYGAVGWVDWNMALDESGGPTYIDNWVDSSILVNAELEEFYKQPMFYAIGHFSKFIIPGSVRIGITLSSPVSSGGVQALAFLRPDNLIAYIIYNSGSSNIAIQIQDTNGKKADIIIEANSINTLLHE